MELPHIGDHCAQPDCNQLDYLPITCTLCNKKFCNEHHKYEDHNCPEQHKVDVKVPICPLCENPVPSKRGVAPDIAVNEHMENNCQIKQKKMYSKKCSYPGCKVKELVDIRCDVCNLTFCLRHRHTADHECKGAAAARRERVLNGGIFKLWKGNDGSTSNRVNGNVPESNGILHVTPSLKETIQGNLSEEEAIRKALAHSREGTREGNDVPTSEDEDLARAIALSLEQQSLDDSQQSRKQRSSDCTIS